MVADYPLGTIQDAAEVGVVYVQNGQADGVGTVRDPRSGARLDV
jgi:hypothetical protein